MLNMTTLLADELGQRLSGVFLRTFGGSRPADRRHARSRLPGSSSSYSPPAMRCITTRSVAALVTLRVRQDILRDCGCGGR